MRLIVLLLYCYLIIFPFGQLARLPVLMNNFPEAHLYLTDILVALMVCVWLGRKLVGGERFTKPPLWLPICLFSLISLVSLAFNSPLLPRGELAVALLYWIRWVFYAGIYFVVYDLTQNSSASWRIKTQSLLNYLMVAGIMAAIFGLLQYVFLPDARFLEHYGWDPHYYRVIGFFLDPGFLGLIFVFTLIILVIRTWQEKKQRNLLIIASLITYLALALTYSRASYLAFLTAMGTIAWWKKSAKFFLIIMLIGIFTLVLLPRPGGEGVKLERTSTIKARILSWQRALTIAQDNLLFGVGFNTYRYAQSRYGFESIEGLRISHSGAGTDSSLLFVLATTGIFGFGAYLWLGAKAFGLGRRLRNNLEVISLATLLAVFIHSFFHNSLFYPWIMGWLWIVMALAKND